MEHVAPDVWQFSGWPRHLFNIYLIGDLLVDAGTRWARPRIFRQLSGRRVSRLLLTHCHPDHQGAARAICEKFRVPLACHHADAAVMEGRQPFVPDSPIMRFGNWIWAGPPYPVAEVLQGDEVFHGFRVVHAPGHTPGHCFLFRESDRLAITGDVVANMNFLTLEPTLLEPPTLFSVDPLENRRSIRKLADLRPRTLLFGHGPPLTDLKKFHRFVDGLKLS